MPRLKHTEVKSSNIASYAYGKASQILEIKFLDGKLYKYLDVPESVWEMFQKAESKGKFANKNIYPIFQTILDENIDEELENFNESQRDILKDV